MNRKMNLIFPRFGTNQKVLQSGPLKTPGTSKTSIQSPSHLRKSFFISRIMVLGGTRLSSGYTTLVQISSLCQGLKDFSTVFRNVTEFFWF